MPYFCAKRLSGNLVRTRWLWSEVLWCMADSFIDGNLPLEQCALVCHGVQRYDGVEAVVGSGAQVAGGASRPRLQARGAAAEHNLAQLLLVDPDPHRGGLEQHRHC